MNFYYEKEKNPQPPGKGREKTKKYSGLNVSYIINVLRDGCYKLIGKHR
jgi:hypothetical protein